MDPFASVDEEDRVLLPIFAGDYRIRVRTERKGRRWRSPEPISEILASCCSREKISMAARGNSQLPIPRNKRGRAAGKRLRGPIINSPHESPEKDAACEFAVCPSNLPSDSRISKDGIEKFRYQSLKTLEEALGIQNAGSSAVPGLRKLPTLTGGPAMEGDKGAAGSSAASGGHKFTPLAPSSVATPDTGAEFPANLLDAVKSISGKPDRRFTDTDLLEIAKMKGIEFPSPSWWRPEGYGLQNLEAHESTHEST